MRVSDEQLPVSIKVTRRNGEWILSITAPRWFIDELDNVVAELRKASSTYNNSSDVASIHYAVKQQSPDAR